ncbi:hypothetical protein OH76DRAFT_140988 [Lentinus brumalis]|uniref:Uncharacterized protein n=1 Tax=Lentinus brumalis TaxID=2498619 RepID=A0A371CPK6_9APHY|nr:hypothetical protein OH76DRAFT_140988 [Polyporus brumalis]
MTAGASPHALHSDAPVRPAVLLCRPTPESESECLEDAVGHSARWEELSSRDGVAPGPRTDRPGRFCRSFESACQVVPRPMHARSTYYVLLAYTFSTILRSQLSQDFLAATIPAEQDIASCSTSLTEMHEALSDNPRRVSKSFAQHRCGLDQPAAASSAGLQRLCLFVRVVCEWA